MKKWWLLFLLTVFCSASRGEEREQEVSKEGEVYWDISSPPPPEVISMLSFRWANTSPSKVVMTTDALAAGPWSYNPGIGGFGVGWPGGVLGERDT